MRLIKQKYPEELLCDMLFSSFMQNEVSDRVEPEKLREISQEICDLLGVEHKKAPD